ncbi:unnamed protein product [Camellia sinensis]
MTRALLCSNLSNSFPSIALFLSIAMIILLQSLIIGKRVQIVVHGMGSHVITPLLMSLGSTSVATAYTVPSIQTAASSILFTFNSSTFQGNNFSNSIFHLQKLQELWLAGNRELTGKLSSFINGTLRHLRLLVLSETGFTGELPNSIGQLEYLEVLYLVDCNFFGTIPTSIGNLKKLRILNLRGNNLINGQVPSSIGHLKNLEYLHLSDCNFFGTIPTSLGNLTRLISLNLSYNNFEGPIPQLFSNFSQLQSIDFSNNQLTGSIPSSLFHLVNLTHLDLSSNNVSNTAELDTFAKLEYLESLDLSNSGLSLTTTNSTPSSFRNITTLRLSSCNINEDLNPLCNLHSLIYLILSNNQFAGLIPTCLGNFSGSLTMLNLQSNNFSGTIPQTFGYASRLQELDISNNGLQGVLPRSLANCTKLEVLNLGHNFIEDAFPFWLQNLPQLKMQRETTVMIEKKMFRKVFGESTLKDTVKAVLIPCYDLTTRSPFVFSRADAVEIDGYDFKMADVCLATSADPTVVGAVTTSADTTVKMSSVDRQTKIAAVGGGVVMNNPTAAAITHVLNNKQEFPFCNGVEDLIVVFLGNGESDFGAGDLTSSPARRAVQIAGEGASDLVDQAVSMAFGQSRTSNYVRIQANGNGKFGTLPSKFFETMPSMMMNDEDKSSLNYMHNDYGYYSVTIMNKGLEMTLIRIITIFKAVDFSHNKFDGNISISIGRLKALVVLNFSGNGFTGSIPSSLVNLTELESLDLSQNKFSGKIPQQLTSLTFLEVFDVSQNKLTGKIPRGQQFETFSNTSYEGNIGLCGLPLSKKCGSPEVAESPSLSSSSSHDFKYKLDDFEWEAVLMGYGCGVVIGLVIGSCVIRRKEKWLVRIFRVKMCHQKNRSNEVRYQHGTR